MREAAIVVRVSNWTAFTSLVHRFTGPGTRDDYAFRGLESAAWSLTPKLHRSSTDGGRLPLPSAADLLEIEKFATDQFRAAAPIELPAAVLASTRATIGWWTVMQHYGVPTRLLDWTSSPYVAAYFACRALPGVDGALYFFHAPSLFASMSALYGAAAEIPKTEVACQAALCVPDSPPVIHVVARQSGLPNRMLSQQGLFTLCSNVGADPHSVLIEALSGATKEQAMGKIVIPAAQKPLFMRFFRTMNVTAASLFPGLDGIGRAIDEVVRSR